MSFAEKATELASCTDASQKTQSKDKKTPASKKGEGKRESEGETPASQGAEGAPQKTKAQLKAERRAVQVFLNTSASSISKTDCYSHIGMYSYIYVIGSPKSC